MRGNLRIVERRGRTEPLNPARQVDICSLLEALPDPALVCSSDGQIVEVNSGMEALSGMQREQLRQLQNLDVARQLWVRDDSHPVEPQELPSSRALRGELVRDESYVLRRPKGEGTQEVLVSANPIRDHDGGITGALLVIRDVTEIAELKRNIDHAERQKTVGQMATGVAHDFNNALDTIGQAVTVLEMKRDAPAEERKVYLGIIRGAVQQGAEIVSRVRDFVSFRAAQFTSINLEKLLEECIDLTRPLWQPAHIEVSRDLAKSCRVKGNKSDLRRVFTNLIINAVEAMPQGGSLTVTCAEEDGIVRVKVSDTGAGISPEDRAKIFRPYFTTKPEGTGIGLSGAQTIIRAHGGEIGFDTEPGAGTTFWVILPRIDKQERRS